MKQRLRVVDLTSEAIASISLAILESFFSFSPHPPPNLFWHEPPTYTYFIPF